MPRAPNRWRGSRRTAANTGVRYLMAIRAASIAASKQSLGERGATIGTGASPLRPNIACSRSDCSVLVGSPVDGPPRWMSQMTSGSSRETASPIVSLFSARPGPDVVVTPRCPPKAAPERGADAGDLVLGLERAHAEPLVLAELVQDVRRRRDRVRAEEQRQLGAPRGGEQPVGQRQVAGDVAVGAGAYRGGLDLVGDREVLGGLAEAPARLERGAVRVEEVGLGWRTSCRGTPSVPSVGRW